MSREYWREVLDTARKTLEELRARRDALDAEREEVNLEIVQLEQVVANLSPLTSDAQKEEAARLINTNLKGVALTEACRIVLKKSNKFMTPIEIRSALEACGYDLSQHNNALASIHGVLKRLVESGEAATLSHDARGTLYNWKSQGTPLPAHGYGMSRREYLSKVVEDEKADLRAKPGAGGDPKPIGEVTYTRAGRRPSRGLRQDLAPADGPEAPTLTKPNIRVPAPPRFGEEEGEKLPGQQHAISKPQPKSSVTYEGSGLTPPKKEGK